MSKRPELTIDISPDDILYSAKVGKFTRFKPSMKRKTKTPLEKFQEYSMDKLGLSLEDAKSLGIDISHVVVHQDDLLLLEEYETQWAIKHTFLSLYKPEKVPGKMGMHFLQYAPTGSRSPGIERGHVYIRIPK